jgi:hypothetical protein
MARVVAKLVSQIPSEAKLGSQKTSFRLPQLAKPAPSTAWHTRRNYIPRGASQARLGGAGKMAP